MLTTDLPIESYLKPTNEIDFLDPRITEICQKFNKESSNEVQKAKLAFEFVRDSISHSADIQSHRITRRASEVLAHQEGICYTKSMLLAAILRGMGIPSGICYQRLVHGDTVESGYDLHALNSVYLKDPGKWIRLDARGNKPGVDAQFSIDVEKLAFPVRTELDEQDYPMNFAEPHPAVTAALARNTDCMWMYHNDLPERL